MSEFLTIKETAGRLEVSERTVKRLIEQGELAAATITPNGCIRILEPSVIHYIELVKQRAYAACKYGKAV